jgi:hypothetical protein
MTPQPAKAAALSEVYDLLRLAAARRQPVAAIYDGLPRLLCPHVLGKKSGRLHAFFYQFGGPAPVALRRRQKEWAAGAVSPWINSAKSSCAPTHDTPSHAPRGKRASMKSILTPTLSPKKIRSRGSAAVAATIGAPGSFVASRSSADYAARGGPGDPRGRKSRTGPQAANPRLPTRAEGEKRLRSATRNP